MQKSASYSNTHNTYEKFRPRYPVDPFQDGLDGPSSYVFDQKPTSKEPWRLDIDKLPPVELTKLCRTVILVLGDPPSQHLLPLLKSRHFFSSLLIIATHSNVYLPAGVFPTVRILKLSEPLEAENRGAERLVRTLEWAECVARVWRVRGGGGVSELQEATEIAQLTESKLQKTERQENSSPNHSRPRPSSSAPNVLRGATRPPSTFGVPRVQTPPSRTSKSRRKANFLPPPDPTQRGFDVLLNFLPATGIPDGYLLKNAILVTTISRPFVIATSSEDPTKKKMRTQSTLDTKRGSRWSLFRQSSLKPTSMPATPFNASTSSIGLVGQRTPSLAPSNAAPSIASSRYPQSEYTVSSALHQTFSNTNPALIIHVLPSPPPHPHNYVYTQKQLAARNKLVASIDGFLSAFGASQASFFPSMGKMHYDSQGTLRGDDKRAFAMGAIPRARPYIVDGNSFANDVLNATGDGDGEWTLAELLCCACLDPNPPPANPEEGKKEHRIWISGISDIVISSSSAAGSVGDDTPRSLTPEPEDNPKAHDRIQRRVSRPLPVPQQQQVQDETQHNQDLSSPSPSPPDAQQTGIRGRTHFTLNSDSASSADESSSPAGLASPVPPTPPEKDFNRGWEGLPGTSVEHQALAPPVLIPVSNENSNPQSHPQDQFRYDQRPRFLSDQGPRSQPPLQSIASIPVSHRQPIPPPQPIFPPPSQTTHSQSAPVQVPTRPVVRAGSSVRKGPVARPGSPFAPPSHPPRSRAPLPSSNAPRPTTYHPPSSTISPPAEVKKSRWKFWK